MNLTMRLRSHIIFLALVFTGCAAVSVEGTRLGRDLSPIEPVAFIIFQSNTPPTYAQILERALSGEMQRRGIPSHFSVVPGAEDAKGGVVAKALSEVPGAIIIAPSDGSPRLNGVTAPIYYDLRALRILKHPGPATPESGPNGTTPINDGTGRFVYLWRGRAYARGGFRDDNLGEVAAQIVAKLVADHILPAMP